MLSYNGLTIRDGYFSILVGLGMRRLMEKKLGWHNFFCRKIGRCFVVWRIIRQVLLFFFTYTSAQIFQVLYKSVYVYIVPVFFCFRLGRKPVLIVTSLCQVMVGCSAAFVGNLSIFLTLYFLQGCLQCGIYILSFVLGEFWLWGDTSPSIFGYLNMNLFSRDVPKYSPH